VLADSKGLCLLFFENSADHFKESYMKIRMQTILAIGTSQGPSLCYVKETGYLDHTLFLPFKLPPHSFDFFFGTLHQNGILCLVIIGLQFERDFIDTIALAPVIDSSIRRNKSKEVPIGLSDSREFFGRGNVRLSENDRRSQEDAGQSPRT